MVNKAVQVFVIMGMPLELKESFMGLLLKVS